MVYVLQQYAESHGNAMLEHGLKPGDSVAVWLPEIAEKVNSST
jgi:hypothetical protein